MYIAAMSNIFDTLGSMSHEERTTWGSLVVSLLVIGGYGRTMIERAQLVPLVEVPYVGPMIWSVALGVAGVIVVAILLGIAWPKDAGASDQRDREIGRFGEYVGRAFLVIGSVIALVLAMLEARHFWIAHALFFGFFLSALLEVLAKLVAYRRGFHAW
jgi:hypothetical protein